MKSPGRLLIVAVVVALLGLGAWHWRAEWMPTGAPPAAQGAVTPSPAPAQPASGIVAAPASAAGMPPAIRHPIEAASGAEVAEPASATLDSALLGLFGRETLLTLLMTEDFARRVVTTVDNLGREKAPARLWPMQPPAGRFTAQRAGDAEVIGAANFVRYARHMELIDKADLRQVVALYKRFYPQFQQAYEELGYPGRHFNDRVVEVIDLLLATAAPQDPVAVQLPVIHGPIQPQRPWLLYEFADPARQASPAGAQLLLRIGPDNQRRLKTRLTELRRLLAR